MRILVVEDDAAIADAVCDALKRGGHSVDHLADGRQALTALREHAFALVVLDLGLPGAEGAEILHKLRSDADPVPVLVITARDELDQRVRALDLGADDYLVKPFALAEFEARVRALLRRRASQGVPLLRIGDLSVDLAGRRALLDGIPLELTAREFGLLEALLPRRDRAPCGAWAICSKKARMAPMNSPSLRRRLLLFVALPLSALLVAGAALTYGLAMYYANSVYDRWLLDSARALGQLVNSDAGRNELSDQARILLQYDPFDRVVYAVRSTHYGLLA